MLRAQQLYEAAKAEDEQLLALKREAGTRLAAMGDNSVLNSLLSGGTPARDATSETWAEVRKREGDINKIYDSAIESDKQAAQMVLNEALSKIEAEQAAETAALDKNLTQTYVNALKGAKNYNEVQGAYGLGSGTLAQARLARALGMTGDLADQRGVQMGSAAKRGQQRFAAGQVFRDALAKSVEANENKRAAELYKAAEAEEQSLIATQKTVGNLLAKQNNYSVLGALYGLTADQIHRLQGTGAYAPVSYGGGGGSGSGDDFTYNGSIAGTAAGAAIKAAVANGGGSSVHTSSGGTTRAGSGGSFGSSGVDAVTSAAPVAKNPGSSSAPNKSTASKLIDIIAEAVKKTYIGS